MITARRSQVVARKRQPANHRQAALVERSQYSSSVFAFWL